MLGPFVSPSSPVTLAKLSVEKTRLPSVRMSRASMVPACPTSPMALPSRNSGWVS